MLEVFRARSMSSSVRVILTILGTLSIVGATIVFLRDIDGFLPSALAASVSFAVGIGLLWLAFRPERLEHKITEAADDGSGVTQTVSSEYERTAMARLRESFDGSDKTPRQPLG